MWPMVLYCKNVEAKRQKAYETAEINAPFFEHPTVRIYQNIKSMDRNGCNITRIVHAMCCGRIRYSNFGGYNTDDCMFAKRGAPEKLYGFHSGNCFF